jgi:hypothetical protein
MRCIPAGGRVVNCIQVSEFQFFYCRRSLEKMSEMSETRVLLTFLTFRTLILNGLDYFFLPNTISLAETIQQLSINVNATKIALIIRFKSQSPGDSSQAMRGHL